MGLNAAAILAGSSPLWFSAVIQHFAVWIFIFIFFKAFFICVYSLHFTAAWVGRRERGGLTMHCGAEWPHGEGWRRLLLSGCF